jgi:LacI family transcriptional regulator
VHSPLIGIGIDLDWPLAHHYDVLQGILAYGRDSGWNCRIEPGLETSDSVDDLLDQYDGIIARSAPALVAHCKQNKIPLVNVWLNAPDQSCVTVCVDLQKVAYDAAAFLLRRGFRNVGFLSRAQDATAIRSLAGVREAAKQFGCDIRTLNAGLPIQLSDWRKFHESVEAWMAEFPLPAAVIASDHIMARHFVDDCLRLGLLVPDDVAVMSCEENAGVCGGLDPGISAMDKGYFEVGKEAAEKLKLLMSGKKVAETVHVVTTRSTLVERRSTSVQPVSDRMVARALRYVWDHSNQPMGVREVAEAVGIPRRRLERRFRSVVNQSINDKIIESRVERAKRLLTETDEPVKLVARAAGFSSSVRLAQVFAQHVGETPTAYRNKYSD